MKFIVTITLLLVFGTISYVSVIALHDFLSVGVLGYFIGSGLELGKFTSIVYIHRNWHLTSKYFYIVVAVLIAALTTSELIGFLSYNHVNATKVSRGAEKELIALGKEKLFLQNQIDLVEKSLQELPVGFVKRKEVARNRKEYKSSVSRITAIMQREKELTSNMKTVSGGGPVYATAELLGIKPKILSRYFIILLVLVWESLSTGLIIAFSVVWKFDLKEKTVNTGKSTKKPTRNEILLRLKKQKGLTSEEIAQMTDRKQVETVESWIKNESEIPVNALKQLIRAIR